MAVFALLAWYLRSPALLTGQDDAAYYLLAESLRSGRYVDLWTVGEPVHIQYPPGYPVVLAALGFLAGGRYTFLLAFNLVCTVATLAVLYWAVARLWGRAVAITGLVAVGLNPHFVLMPGELRPEAMFGLLVMAALALTLTQRHPRRAVFAIGAGAVLGALVRLPGLALPAAIGVHWLLERRYRAAVLLALVTAITAGAWLLWTLNAPEQYVGASYGADLAFDRYAAGGSVVSTLMDRVERNLLSYGAAIVPQVLMLPAIPDTPIDNILIGGIASVGLLAGMLVLWRRWRPAGLMLLGYGAILAVWVWQANRYLTPLIPLLVIVLLVGVRRAGEAVRPALGLPAMFVVAAVMALQGFVRTAEVVSSRLGCDATERLAASTCVRPDGREYFEALEYIAAMAPDDAVLLTSKPEPAFVHIRRQTVRRNRMIAQLSGETSPSLQPLRDAGVTLVLLGHLASADQGIYRELERRCSEVTALARFGKRTHLFAVGRIPGRPDGCAALEDYRAAAMTGDRFLPYRRAWPPGDFHPPMSRARDRSGERGPGLGAPRPPGVLALREADAAEGGVT